MPTNPAAPAYRLPTTGYTLIDHVATGPSLTHIGFTLSRTILWIIAGYILVFIILIFIKTGSTTDLYTLPDIHLTDTLFSRKLQLINSLQTEQKNNRDFYLQISQMILLNLLLPILTAVLGYIFGTNTARTVAAES